MVTQMEKEAFSIDLNWFVYGVCRSFLLFHCLPPYWPGNDEIILRVGATPPQRIENRRRKIFFLREIGWLSGSPRWFSMAKGSFSFLRGNSSAFFFSFFFEIKRFIDRTFLECQGSRLSKCLISRFDVFTDSFENRRMPGILMVNRLFEDADWWDFKDEIFISTLTSLEFIICLIKEDNFYFVIVINRCNII